MKLYELFGITGVRKHALNVFLTQSLGNTLDGMAADLDTKRWVLSLSKRLTGTLIPNLFHIRNVVAGREKYLNQKLTKYVAPHVRSAVKSATVDHPELKDSVMDSEEFVVNFIEELTNNKEQFKQTIS